MPERFTIGIEEEFQTVHHQTGQLLSCIHPILEKVLPVFGKKIKTELLQPTLELTSDIYPDIHVARSDIYKQRALLAQLVQELGIALISAGTHPDALWQQQKRTEGDRYEKQEKEEQDVGRSLLIFGLHIHIGVTDKELAVSLINQLRTWLPHLLALSSNSPFWGGRFTGLKSYRSAIWGICPRSGLPPILSSRAYFDQYVQALIHTGCIHDSRGIWWDIRPHTLYDTIELRILDMPGTLEDTLAITALCQALVAKLAWLHEHDKQVPVLASEYIEENKWRAMRYGLDAEIIDFVSNRCLGMRAAVHELINFVEDVAEDLGSDREMHYIRALVDSQQGTGADRQIATYHQYGGVRAVVNLLMEQTMVGVKESTDDKKAIHTI